MITSKKLNHFEMLDPADDGSLGFSDELTVDLAPIAALDLLAHDDDKLRCLWECNSPFGAFRAMKSDIIRYLHWLLMFRCFQRGAFASFEEGVFSGYRRQDPWYLIVGPHDQMQCVAAQFEGDSIVGATRYVSNATSKKPIYDNLERFVLNRQVERLAEEYMVWLRETGEFLPYLDQVTAIDFASIEGEISDQLKRHYRTATAAGITYGGVNFQWTGSRDGGKAFGQGFRYRSPLA